MTKQADGTQFVKVINNYTGNVDYGTVTSETKCYITVTVKNYYSNGNSLVSKLYKRDGAMYNWDDSLSYYLIFPEEVSL